MKRLLIGSILLNCILTIFIAACSQVKDSVHSIRQEMPLDKYNFVRDTYNENDLEYLMGNAEMGGLADIKGLSFENLWFADLWADSIGRLPLAGPLLSCDVYASKDYTTADFHNELRLRDGVFTTSVKFPDSGGYESKIFFSKTNKHLLIMELKDFSEKKKNIWKIDLPIKGFEVMISKNNMIRGITKNKEAYTQTCWALRSNLPVNEEEGAYSFTIPVGKSLTLLYSVTTHFDGKDYIKQAQDAVSATLDIDKLELKQKEAWDVQWNGIGSVILPDCEYAKWFYRSIYTLYATAGSDKFLPGELQFSVPDIDWRMHAFTYGHAGWALWAFATMGDKDKAFKMAQWHYKPAALKKNVRIIFPDTGKVEVIYRNKSKGRHLYREQNNPDAMAFGHELSTNGYNVTYEATFHWDWQRHLDAFAASMFHLLDRYYPDDSFTKNYTYPVMRGTAELWRSLAKWDNEKKMYYLPPLLSLSENIMEKSVLDAVLAAKWNLMMSSQYAERLNLDNDSRKEWMEISENLYVPQNQNHYLEFLDDKEDRAGGGYFGIRACAYLGFPLLERIKFIDKAKARNTLDQTWKRNNQGKGMITFVMNWFALTEAYFGYGDKAYEISSLCTKTLDASSTTMCEVIAVSKAGVERRINPFFLTGYSSLILVPISMMLQSYDNQIRVFPSMPSVWKDAAFYDLPAEGGIKVSAVMENGQVKWISCKKQGEELLRLFENKKIKIIQKNNRVNLQVN